MEAQSLALTVLLLLPTMPLPLMVVFEMVPIRLLSTTVAQMMVALNLPHSAAMLTHTHLVAVDLMWLEVNGLHSMADSVLVIHFVNYPNHLCGLFAGVGIVASNQLDADRSDHLDNYSPRGAHHAIAAQAQTMAHFDLAFVDFDTTSDGIRKKYYNGLVLSEFFF